MVEQDTVRLLRECDAGIKMGVSSIDEVIDKVKNKKLKDILKNSKDDHEALGNETHTLLNKMGADDKEPNPIAKSMSYIKTNFMLAVNEGDETIADLMTDGCNMGIKSLYKYLNQYPSANSKVKDLCKRLISIEDQLRKELRAYL